MRDTITIYEVTKREEAFQPYVEFPVFKGADGTTYFENEGDLLDYMYCEKVIHIAYEKAKEVWKDGGFHKAYVVSPIAKELEEMISVRFQGEVDNLVASLIKTNKQLDNWREKCQSFQQATLLQRILYVFTKKIPYKSV